MARAIWLVIVLGLIAVVIAIPFAVRARFEGFTIPSTSMAPGLLPGDYILVDKSVRDAERGHLIVFSDPNDNAELLVKRVVGLGGEELHVNGRRVFVGCAPGAVGCEPLVEPWADFTDQQTAPERSGVFEIPAGSYFVMADNRNAGEDSRHYGPVSWQRITGRPFLIYWSSDPSTGSVRWGRVGSRIR